jgi:RNA polymerase sigma factor (sigma-70 family)
MNVAAGAPGSFMIASIAVQSSTVVDDDAGLFASWTAGDQRAGNRLLARHYVRIRRFFLSKDESHHEDLTSRTFEECLKSRHLFRGEGSFRSYLFGIAYRVLLRHLRERRRHDFTAFDPETHAIVDAGLPALSSWVFASEQARVLLACLRRLNLNAQTVLELRYWSGLSEPEIQGILKLRTREAVSGRLRLARESLRREWARAEPGYRLGDADFDAWMAEIRGRLDSRNSQGL